MSTTDDAVIVAAVDAADPLASLLPFADVVIVPSRGRPAAEWFAQLPGLGGVLVLGRHGCTVWFRDGIQVACEGPVIDPVAVATFAHDRWVAGHVAAGRCAS